MSPAINGIKVPQNLLGNLIETNLFESKDIDLQNALKKDGYIYIKNVVNEDEISKAREDIFEKLGEVNELKHPFSDGIASGKSNRDVLFSN